MGCPATRGNFVERLTMSRRKNNARKKYRRQNGRVQESRDRSTLRTEDILLYNVRLFAKCGGALAEHPRQDVLSLRLLDFTPVLSRLTLNMYTYAN